jgi:4-hydroxy-tetrahydrodipicolinate synthase
MLYDVPSRTGTQIAMETYEAASAWDTVVAVKDAVGDFARGVRLTQLGYAVYSGDDVANLAWLAHGGSGFVSVVGHAAGDQLKAMADAFFAGDHAEALTIFTRMLPAIDAVMGVPNYGATTAKAALQLLGVLDNRNVRAPLVALDDDEVAALRAGLDAAGLLQGS